MESLIYIAMLALYGILGGVTIGVFIFWLERQIDKGVPRDRN